MHVESWELDQWLYTVISRNVHFRQEVLQGVLAQAGIDIIQAIALGSSISSEGDNFRKAILGAYQKINA